jgi:hypothetical protein
MTQLLTPLAFANRHLGQRVTAPGGIGGQCVDLINVWLIDSRGLPAVRLNAVDWAGKKLPGLAWVANKPANVPPRGAIVVWGESADVGTGVDGHIAINLTADAMTLCTCDQNWGGEIVTLQLHSYHGVLGWHVPG